MGEGDPRRVAVLAPHAIVWLRRDLRLSDHAPFHEAAERGGTVLPVFVEEARALVPGQAPGAAAAAYRKESLRALAGALSRRGGRLLLRRGSPEEVLPALARETGASVVLFTSHPDPWERQVEERVRESLQAASVPSRSFPYPLLHDPASTGPSSGPPYRVFTPFWNALRRLPPPGDPLPAPPRLPAPRPFPEGLLPDEAIPGDGSPPCGIATAAGEERARGLLETFLDGPLSRYPRDRDLPATEGTSRLSPSLHHGEITPRTVWRAVAARCASSGDGEEEAGGEAFLRQLAWREFAHHLLRHFPLLPRAPFRPAWSSFPWREDREALGAWKRGETGFPFVDAGMRELAATGWMHNRARLADSSFLAKDLLLPWTEGAAHFLGALADGDVANNSFGWQWVAGSGADGAPFFRVFNPATQGERFDRAGRYVRRWVPELASLPDRWIHRPHEAPPAVLRDAGVRLGEDYPRPLVDHGAARERALRAFSLIQEGKGKVRHGRGSGSPGRGRKP